MAISNSPLSSYRGPAGTTDLSGILKQAQSATDSISEAGKKFIGVGESILEKKDDASFNRARAYLNTLTDPTEIDVFRQDFLANADPQSKNYAQLAKDIENQQQVGQERFLAQDKFDKTKRGIANQDSRDAIAGLLQKGDYAGVQNLLDTTEFNNEGLLVAELEKAKQGTDSSAFTAELSGTLTEEDARNVVIPESFTPEQRSKAQAEINARALSNKARARSDEDSAIQRERSKIEFDQRQEDSATQRERSEITFDQGQLDRQQKIDSTKLTSKLLSDNRANIDTLRLKFNADNIPVNNDGSLNLGGVPADQQQALTDKYNTLLAEYPVYNETELQQLYYDAVSDLGYPADVTDAASSAILKGANLRVQLSKENERLRTVADSADASASAARVATLKREYDRALLDHPIDDEVSQMEENKEFKIGTFASMVSDDVTRGKEENSKYPDNINETYDNIEEDEQAEVVREMNKIQATGYTTKLDKDSAGKEIKYDIPEWVMQAAFRKVGLGNIFTAGLLNDTIDMYQYKTAVDSIMRGVVKNKNSRKTRADITEKFNGDLTAENLLLTQKTAGNLSSARNRGGILNADN